MRRNWINSVLLATIVWVGPAAMSALACPFCGEANAVDAHRSNAFQFSILFMLGMPFVLAAAFGVGFYRLSRQARTEPADNAPTMFTVASTVVNAVGNDRGDAAQPG